MEVNHAVLALGALAQEPRLYIFRALVEAGPEGLPVEAIGEKLGVSSPTLSVHLQRLNYAGLNTKRRARSSLIYSVSVKGHEQPYALSHRGFCGGRSELCAPASINASIAPATKRASRKRR
jgi:DNA-binding transcriptional ArsR family regulator